MGRHMRRLLKFVIDYPGWHTLSKNDPAARRAVHSLVDYGLMEWSAKTHQFRLPPPSHERGE